MASASATAVLRRGIWKENPVFVQLLGLCPALAVTNTVVNGLAMGLATGFVAISSSIFISALRRLIPHSVRISTYVLIVGTFVTIVDLFMQATVPLVSQALGAFVYLIVVNCMILSRHEMFASRNPVWRSALDAVGTSLGFLLALLLMGGTREILSSGSLLGYNLFGPGFEPWVIMALPPGGFFTIAFLLLGMNALKRRERPTRVRRWMNDPVISEVAS
ncbi:MAG: electron transport complex subunit RsxE [Gemmatimonadota bacterium]